MSSKYASRVPSASDPSSGVAGACDPVFSSAYPALWEYLTLIEWGPGQPRVPSTLLVFLEDGRWKACLVDKDQDRVGWRSSDTLAGLLEAVEGALACSSMDWRRQRAQPGRPRR